MSWGVTDAASGLIRRTGLRTLTGGGGGQGAFVNTALSAPGPPFWESWVLDITYTGATVQQLEWAEEALNECTYPMESLGVKIDVIWGPLPGGADIRHPYMVTQFTTGVHATIYIPTDADDPNSPLVAGLPNAQADIKEFYKESFVHELGHVAVGATIDSSNRPNRAALIAAACGLFTRIDNGRPGLPSDWDDPTLSWANEIREAIAEAFKCSFYSERAKLIYRNRTNWTISRRNWAALLKVWEPGTFALIDTDNLLPGTAATVDTGWFFGGSVFTTVTEDISPPYWQWLPGGVALSQFSIFTPGVPFPPPKPPLAIDHGWGTDDETQTWARGDIDNYVTTPPLPLTMSRKGRAELWVNTMNRAACFVRLGLTNDVGHPVAGVSYQFASGLGFNLTTAYAISASAISRGLPGGGPGVPINPPVLFVIEVDADADTITAGVTHGATDEHGNYIFTDSITGPINDARPQGLYYPSVELSWTMIGDDLQYPTRGLYSELAVGESTWTTYPTPVKGPYPYPEPPVAGVHHSGLLRVD